MKNNRALINTGDAAQITRNLGDPELFAGIIRDEEDVGDAEIVQLTLGHEGDRAVYSEIKNNPDRYEVVQETDFGGRDNVLVVLRYLRKGPWKPDLRHLHSPPDSGKGSKKRQPDPERTKVAGFAGGVKKNGKPKSAPGPEQPQAAPPVPPAGSGTTSSSTSRIVGRGNAVNRADSREFRSGSGIS